MLGRSLVVAVARSSSKKLLTGSSSSKSSISQSISGSLAAKALSSSSSLWNVHYYSTSVRRCNNKEDDFVTMNGEDYSEEEVRKMIEEEMGKAEEERIAKEYRDWVPGYRKRPLEVAYNEEAFDESVVAWNGNLHKRVGALAIKLGMMPIWDEWGERHACTVLHVDRNVVMKTLSVENGDGYNAVQIGAGEYKKKNVTKPVMGHYAKCGVDDRPPYVVKEFRLSYFPQLESIAMQYPEVGTTIHARHFTPGQNVDIVGITKGKGFQGAMKRHGFAGMPATHGTSKSHRALGSTGACQDPGKVWKGKKMAGRMGHAQRTVQNLRILKIDRGRNLIYVKGAVPGNKGEFLRVQDAIKKPLFGTDLVTDAIPHPPIPTFSYDPSIDGSGQPEHEELKPPTDRNPFLPDDAELL